MTKRCPLQQKRRRQKRRLFWLFILLLSVGALLLGLPSLRNIHRLQRLKEAPVPAWITQDYIPVGHARSGRPLTAFNGVVIHYVGNPGTSARGNRNYFAQESTEVVSHFVVGLDGEILQCLPLHERSVANNSRNRDTISIEVCHPDDSGRFNDATYAAVVKLTAWLCALGSLPDNAVIRHYDITGKECPRYYVRHPAAWEQLCADVKNTRATTDKS